VAAVIACTGGFVTSQQAEKCQVVTGVSFVAGAEASVAGLSGHGAFDDPAAAP
jgi:hypothetical protein